jgi:FkbM family methyltransferase
MQLSTIARLPITLLKPLLRKSVLKEGAVRTILWGPCRGLRYRIFPDFGLSPLLGGWEREVQQLMVKHIKVGSVVYDIGANYGIHTLLMARRAGRTGHVYAFEPSEEIMPQLQVNIKLNAFTNVTCLQLAVSDSIGSATFVKGQHKGAGHLAGGGQQMESNTESQVETITLDDAVFAASRRCKLPHFVKIDVEGAESKVLRGAKRVLAEAKPILLIELHNPEEDTAVGQILLRHGYNVYRARDGSRVKDLTRGWPHVEGIWGQILALPRAG